MSWNRLDWLAILALSLMPLIFFAPVVFHGQTFFLHDISTNYLPQNAFNTRTLHKGELPLWNKYLEGGFPSAGEPESAPSYLLNLILLLPFPITTTHTWYVIVHYMLAGVLTYLLVRYGLSLGRMPSLIAGLTFAFSGTMIAQLTNFTLVTTLVWMPLILFLFIRALERPKVGYAVLAGLVMAVQISKSHTQIALYTAGVLALYVVFAVVMGLRAGKGTHSLVPVAYLFVTLLVSAGLSAYQLVYTAELIQRSNRSTGLNYAAMTALSYPPLYLVEFLVPGFFGSFKNYVGRGNFPEMHAYAGLLPLLLTPFAFSKPRHWRVWFFTTLLMISVVLSFGKFTPLYRGLIYVPIFNFFRVPSRWLFLVTFCISILGAYGVQKLIDLGQPDLRTSNGRVQSSILAFLLVGLLMIGAVAAVWDSYICITCELGDISDSPKTFTTYYNLTERDPDDRAYLVIEPVQGNSFEVEQKREEEAFQQRAVLAYRDMQRSLFLFLVMLAAGLILVVARWRALISSRMFKVLALLFVVFDILVYGGLSYNPTADRSYFLEQPGTVEFLKQVESSEPYRIFPTNRWIPYPHNVDYVLSTLAFNTPSLYEIESITGEVTLPLRRHTGYMMHAIGPAGQAGGLQMLSIANVKYIISEWDLEDNPHLKLVFRGDRQKIFENLSALPRAFAVHHVEVITDDAAILDRLADVSFDPTGTVILEEQPAHPLPARLPRAPSTVQIVAHEHNRVAIDVDMADTGFLFLSDVHYPGWNAYVDGQASRVYRANYLFRAVEVGAGVHNVEFRYEPLSFLIGSGVTLLTVAVLVGWGAFAWSRTRRFRVPRPFSEQTS
jgi:hypothetical protein